MTTAALPFDPTVDFLPSPLREAGKDFFIYNVEFIPLEARVATARSSAFFKVEEDHAFLITQAAIMYTTNADAVVGPPATTPIPLLCTMGLADTNTQLVQQTVPGANDSPIDNWFGFGQQPAYWALPFLCPPSSTFVVQLTSLEAVARNVRLSFIGGRIYRARAADPWDFCRRGW